MMAAMLPPARCCAQTIAQTSGPVLRGVEVELDLRPHGIVEEHLPDAGVDLPAHRIRDGVAVELRERRLEAARAEGDVVDDAGALARKLALRGVEDGFAARVEPDAAEGERRPRAHGQTQDAH